MLVRSAWISPPLGLRLSTPAYVLVLEELLLGHELVSPRSRSGVSPCSCSMSVALPVGIVVPILDAHLLVVVSLGDVRNLALVLAVVLVLVPTVAGPLLGVLLNILRLLLVEA